MLPLESTSTSLIYSGDFAFVSMVPTIDKNKGDGVGAGKARGVATCIGAGGILGMMEVDKFLPCPVALTQRGSDPTIS